MEIRLRKISNNQVVSKKSKLFGIGDVYFIAGQSNASGYEWQNVEGQDKGLQAYNSNYEQMDAVSVFSKYQPNANNKVAGLPNETQFSKLVAGNASSAQTIHPSGRHSWCWGPLGSKIAKDVQVPVLFFNAAQPQSSSSIWKNIDGGAGEWVSQKFRSALQMYGSILGTRGVLWHQGEDDANEQTKSSKTNFCDYTGNLNTVINTSRTALLGSSTNKNLTWFVSQTSYYSYPFDIFNQGCNNYCVYNNRSDALLPSFNGMGCDVSSLNFTGNICTSSSGVKPYNPSLANAQYSMINASENIKSGIFTDNITNRGSCQKIHFNGDALLDVANRWYEKLYPSNQAASTSPIEGSILTPISVADLGGSYRLSLPSVVGRKYFWVKNDEGVYDTAPSSNFFDVNKANINNTYICYYSDDNDPDGTVNNGWNLRLKASQPFRIPSNTKSLGWGQLTLGFGSGSETKTVNILSTNVIWNIINIPSWVTSISSTSGGDGTTTISIQVAANISSSERPSVNIIVQEDGGTISQTLTITQSANSNCTQTNLSSLSPVNASGEWSGWGSMHNNQSVIGNPLRVSAYQTSNGIGTHAGSRLVYSLGGAYGSFSGSVGRDDEADNCDCGGQKLQFIIKADGATLFTSNLLGVTDSRQPFNVNVAGKSQIELLVTDGGDEVYGDHADWLDAVLSCGASACTPPYIPTGVVSNPSIINVGQSSILSATCATGTTTWNTNQTGGSITVSPTATSTYSVKCVSNACESNAVSVGVTVNSSSGACSVVSNNLVMGTWNITGHQLVARLLNGQYWLTQRISTNPDAFVMRGANMLERSDVSLINNSYSSLIPCFAFQYSGYGGLIGPDANVFPTPSGYTFGYLSDGTPFYQPSGVPPSCTNTDLSNNWLYASADYNSPPKINAKHDGSVPLRINNANFAKGIGTHANAEIVYTLGNHNFTNFKASVGRDFGSYTCACGTQTIVFKVFNNTTGALIGGPIVKGNYQDATDISVDIAGVTSLKLVVEDGGDNNWGDWADWGNARLTCANNNAREPAPVEDWFWVSPNPNDGKFVAKVNLKISQSVQLYLSDIKGNIIKEYSFVGTEGMNSFEINMQDKVMLESIYNVRCQAGENAASKRVIIEK